MMELITTLGLGAGAGWTAKKLFEPALEAMGEDIASAYKGFRIENLRSIFIKAEKKLEARQGENIEPLKPKLLAHLIEHASIEDDDSIQELWASIIATASSDNEADTLFLSNILSRITAREAMLFSQFCDWSSFDFSRPLTADDFGDLQNTYADLISTLPLPIDGSNLSWQPILTDLLWHRNFCNRHGALGDGFPVVDDAKVRVPLSHARWHRPFRRPRPPSSVRRLSGLRATWKNEDCRSMKARDIGFHVARLPPSQAWPCPLPRRRF